MGVKLEIFRMVLYLSFPVTMFWISNQAEYFEEYVVKRKRQELEAFQERMRQKQEERLLQQLQNSKDTSP